MYKNRFTLGDKVQHKFAGTGEVVRLSLANSGEQIQNGQQMYQAWLDTAYDSKTETITSIWAYDADLNPA